MDKKLLLLVIPLFLLFFSTNAYAYLPVDLNVTITSSSKNLRDFNCVNASEDNNIYCFISYTLYSGFEGFYMYNETGGFIGSCNLYPYDIGAIIPVNKTFIWVTGGGSSGVIYLRNISDIVSGNCPIIATKNAGLSYNVYGGDMSFSGNNNRYFWGAYISGKYEITNESGNIIYTDNSYTPYDYDIAYPNKSSNTTIYAITSSNKDVVYKWINGTKSYSVSSCADYNICSPLSFDIIDIGKTRYYYFIDQIGTTNQFHIYRVNLTYREFLSSVGHIIALNPLNSTYDRTEIILSVNIISDYTGNLKWYLDNVNIANTSITTTPNNSNFYYSVGILTEGNHTWFANYTEDTSGYSPDTSLIYFTIAVQGDITREGLTLIKNLLGLENEESARSLLVMVIIIAISVYVAMKVEDNKGQIFLAVFGGLVIICWLGGIIPTIIGFIILILIALLFAQTIKEYVS